MYLLSNFFNRLFFLHCFHDLYIEKVDYFLL